MQEQLIIESSKISYFCQLENKKFLIIRKIFKFLIKKCFICLFFKYNVLFLWQKYNYIRTHKLKYIKFQL